MRTFFTAAAALATISTPAAAAPKMVRGAVIFDRPVQVKRLPIAQEYLWQCSGNSCTGWLAKDPGTAARYCRYIARRLGEVVAFASGDVVFDADALRRCNTGR